MVNTPYRMPNRAISMACVALLLAVAFSLPTAALSLSSEMHAGGASLSPFLRGFEAGECSVSRHSNCCEWDGVESPDRAVTSRGVCCGEADEGESISSLNAWAAASLSATHRRPVLRIRMNHGSAGFFAYVLFALNQLGWAEERGVLPFVDFGQCVVNGGDHYASGAANLFHDPAHGSNMWEYFFEPLSMFDASLAASYDVRSFSSSAMWYLHMSSPTSIYSYYYGLHADKKAYDHSWFGKMRARANDLLRRYVRVKPHIRGEVDRFWEEEVAPAKQSKLSGHAVIGVHMRGTDKQQDIGGGLVEPATYTPYIDRLLVRWPNATLLVATDSTEFLAELTKTYPGRVVARPALRSQVNAFLDESLSDRQQKGADVLIDALLLSRSDFLLKCSSAVGEFAIYWNPALHDASMDVQLASDDLPYRLNFFSFAAPGASASAPAESTAAMTLAGGGFSRGLRERLRRPRQGLDCYARRYDTVFQTHCSGGSSKEGGGQGGGAQEGDAPSVACDWEGVAADWAANGTALFRSRLCEDGVDMAANPAACSPLEIAATTLALETDACRLLVDCEVVERSMLKRCATPNQTAWAQLLLDRWGPLRDTHERIFSSKALLADSSGRSFEMPKLDELVRDAATISRGRCARNVHLVVEEGCFTTPLYSNNRLISFLAHEPRGTCVEALVVNLCRSHTSAPLLLPSFDVRDRMFKVHRMIANSSSNTSLLHAWWAALHATTPDATVYASSFYAVCANGYVHTARRLPPLRPAGSLTSPPAHSSPPPDLRFVESVRCYAMRYSDVRQACIPAVERHGMTVRNGSTASRCNLTLALRHYLEVGASLGRSLRCDGEGGENGWADMDMFARSPRSLLCYVARYDDLFANMCNSHLSECTWNKLRHHYVHDGLAEGRLLRCDRLADAALVASSLWSAAVRCFPGAERPASDIVVLQSSLHALLADGAALTHATLPTILPQGLNIGGEWRGVAQMAGGGKRVTVVGEGAVGGGGGVAAMQAGGAALENVVSNDNDSLLPTPNARRSVSLRCLEPDFMLFNRMLLPRTSLPESLCVSPESPPSAAVLASMVARSSFASCAEEMKPYARLRTTLIHAGWFSTLSGIVLPLSRALQEGRRLEIDGLTYYTDPITCPSRGLDCFFEPVMPPCPPAHHHQTTSPSPSPMSSPASTSRRRASIALFTSRHKASRKRREEGRERQTWGGRGGLEHGRRLADGKVLSLGFKEEANASGDPHVPFYDLEEVPIRDSYTTSGPSVIPAPLRERGYFYWATQLTSLALKPSANLSAMIDLALISTKLGSALASPSPVLGLHVRRGDSCRTDEMQRMARTCSLLSDYLNEIEAYATDTGIKTIYIATDSEDVIQETLSFPQYEFLYLPLERSSSKQKSKLWDHLVKDRLRDGKTSETQHEVMLATVDMYLLSKCDVFVGKFTSNFFRVAYAIKSASCDCAPPFVSLDAPWCSGYGYRDGSNYNFPVRNGSSSNPGTEDNRFWC